MNIGDDPNPGQYIDRILITSNHDLQVAEIIISPEITSCSRNAKDIDVVIRTTTNEGIDFSRYQTELVLETPNGTFTKQLTGTMPGNMSNQIRVASGVNFGTGTHILKAYLSVTIDSNRSNDTVYSLPIKINPELSISVRQLSDGSSLIKGVEAEQEVRVNNTGNMEIPEVTIVMEVTTSQGVERIEKTVTVNLSPGQDTTIKMDTYTVPSEPDYVVGVTAFMTCDPLVTDNTATNEYVDMDDLTLSFVRPQEGIGVDTIGYGNVIEILVENGSDIHLFSNVVVIARIEDANGGLLSDEIRDVIPTVDVDSTFYVFKEKYTVPDVSEYFIRIFLASRENYPKNDTIYQSRTTVPAPPDNNIISGEANVFTLEQNVPNPTDNITSIGYTIPEAGEVIFNLQTASGQLLYTRVIQSEAGLNIIELNTNDFSAGIYLYSVEYKGQKLIKRMSVKN